ncbi:hypothetical protein CES86_5155 [Brucella lupini]|uniref:Uncharacterized protein n=1 Tax=Brucella lupini TaxID=255457 RepID=A0A256GBM0_9HYPH|nr:hypothetical protein CES86_5155 [Brucella lupini]
MSSSARRILFIVPSEFCVVFIAQKLTLNDSISTVENASLVNME